MKPRISRTLLPTHSPFYQGYWQCWDMETSGWGDTPMVAYERWLARKARHAQAHVPPLPASHPFKTALRRVLTLLCCLPGALVIGGALGLLLALCHGW